MSILEFFYREDVLVLLIYHTSVCLVTEKISLTTSCTLSKYAGSWSSSPLQLGQCCICFLRRPHTFLPSSQMVLFKCKLLIWCLRHCHSCPQRTLVSVAGSVTRQHVVVCRFKRWITRYHNARAWLYQFRLNCLRWLTSQFFVVFGYAPWL